MYSVKCEYCGVESILEIEGTESISCPSCGAPVLLKNIKPLQRKEQNVSNKSNKGSVFMWIFVTFFFLFVMIFILTVIFILSFA